MRKKKVNIFKELETNAQITFQKDVKEIHPVVKDIVYNLAELEFIHFIRVSPEYLQASNELTEGRFKIPITKPNHPTAIGVHLIMDFDHKDIQFYEITSAIKGCGGEMADAVMSAFPSDWKGYVVMDWSRGFWDRMKERHKKLHIL
jgi:hypothetical protein